MFQRLMGAVVGLAVAGMVTAAQGATVNNDFAGMITDGPGSGEQLSGNYSYGPSQITNTVSVIGGTGNAVYGDFDSSIYEFANGGMSVAYSGGLNGQIEALAGGTNFIEVIDGSLRDAYRFSLVGDSGDRFTYYIVTTDTNFLDDTNLPIDITVPNTINLVLG